MSLCLLWSAIILNDLAKVIQLCWAILKERRERIKIEKRKREEIEMEYEYSHKLEMYLDKVHLQLVKACERRAFKKRNNEKQSANRRNK